MDLECTTRACLLSGPQRAKRKWKMLTSSWLHLLSAKMVMNNWRSSTVGKAARLATVAINRATLQDNEENVLSVVLLHLVEPQIEDLESAQTAVAPMRTASALSRQ